MRFLFTALLAITIPFGAFAVEFEPATKEKLVGTWQVFAIFGGRFEAENPESHYLAKSQIYGFYEDGHMRSLTADQEKSYTQNLTELEAQFGKRPATLHYEVLEDGLVATTVDPKRQIGTLWDARIALEEGEYNGVALEKGDLIMAMTPKKGETENTPRYLRIMRKNK